jgi:hypothetical protein
VREVPDTDRAHHARWHGNEIGIGVEICGRADQTTAQWDDPISRATIANTAREVAALCRAHTIPPVRLTVAQTRAAYYAAPSERPRGIVAHDDITKAFPEDGGSHWDPGPGFPWPRFLALVQVELDGGSMALTEQAAEYLIWRVEALAGDRSTYAGGPQKGSPVPAVRRAQADSAKLDALAAAAAADETRDVAVLAAIDALASAGGIDAAPIIAAIREEAATSRQAVIDLQAVIATQEATIERLTGDLARLRERLGAAARAEADTLANDG